MSIEKRIEKKTERRRKLVRNYVGKNIKDSFKRTRRARTVTILVEPENII